MYTASSEVREQFPGVDCLRIVVNHHQVRGLDMGAGTYNPTYTRQPFFNIMYLFVRQRLVDMNHSIGIIMDHLTLRHGISVKIEISSDGVDYNEGLSQQLLGLIKINNSRTCQADG
ncbi:MAG: hypothetical protein B6D72_01475 [gamma proteobacterium symbiont of Ctena orbiculata]|nr:MAG: hypothetical protein DBP00_18635 [gamma proteobacterium symbiont of Ctena orbiculata]PVV07864.1 MAG: hypothetical protein B6D82_16015 [gamma proteobacterium symbiont of Ctena orbiculata]PVV15957.1 MAG: hypothetical protein B6D72_01475 [gamma proteobacterium symbiont of Ctena orbiculata]PVV20661.1 MAG: hypothetical protein B6D74_12805 [gamma proteobacterium symbiont of Ctena orbiculata]